MTAQLREALRAAAADVPTYPVHDRALATARRSRRRAVLAAIAALVLVALAGAVLPLARTPAVDPAADADARLPDRIALPPLGTLHATDRPRPGPASVIFSGSSPRLRGWFRSAVVGVVGADSDRYRVLSTENESPAGEQVVLSAEGRYVATPSNSRDQPGIDVVDLVTGRTRQLRSAVADSVESDPLAWSPDGGRLVVRDKKPVASDGATYTSVLSIVTLDGERWTRLAEGAEEAHFGSAVAFAQDGTRLAYQYGATVGVADVDGRELSSFPLAGETWLAGKGAWAPDGTLTLVSREAGTTDWNLRRVDPQGRDAGALRLPDVGGVAAIRLLGWNTGDSALVVAYQPDPVMLDRFAQPLPMNQRTVHPDVRTVTVLALTPGAPAPRVVMTAPDQVLAVDVADEVIHSGRTRDARPPGGVGARFWYWAFLAAVVVTGLVAWRGREALALWRDNRRIRRARGLRR
ncbi:TolB family protein [Micromonospora krabiensis]|uniref:WD40-like Beta Propeller Repeat n=1 Tax=Micromonospora krabiensis TaxID=307121 RepID=A0A1C3N885_9ACTN|nr:hypothetical protein [Micromonospora krabiensis]SBV28798.1 hypothetical protein GA0070620_4352 [Micromonospora krabiensis]